MLQLDTLDCLYHLCFFYRCCCYCLPQGVVNGPEPQLGDFPHEALEEVPELRMPPEAPLPPPAWPNWPGPTTCSTPT